MKTPDVIMAVTPGHGEIEPCPEISKKDLIREYAAIIEDVISGYVENYNRENKDDPIPNEAIEDWTMMELEQFVDMGPNRMHDKLMEIINKYN